MGKKNLDKFFQEKFKDFSEVPDEKVWNAIEASLNRKKKKRIVPLWWKLGGAAAVLALALIVWNPFSDSADSVPTVTRTDTNDTEKSDTNKEGQEDVLQLPTTNKQTVVEKTGNEKTSDAETGQEVSNNAVADTSKDDPATDALENQEPSQEKPTLVDSDSDNGDAPRTIDPSPISKDLNSKNTQLTATQKETDNDSDADQNPIPKKETINIANGKKNEAIANTTDTETEEADIHLTDIDKKNATGIARTETDSETTGQHLGAKQTIESNTEEKVAQNHKDGDKTIDDDPKKKSIFEAIDEQNNEDPLAEKSNGRWSAGPSIAPVYFNGIGEGSPVHSIFAQNSKSGNTNLSYGISVAYEINSKLRLRSGIHKVDYGYDTDNVEFSSSLQASANERIENINYATTAKNLVVRSEAGNFSNAEASNNDAAVEFSAINSSAENGTMAQQFGYLEVPLELDYALIDRKFGLNLVGGVSSLFLLNNLVTLTSGDLTTEIGEANNINTINFSTNIGFGVNYKFSPRIQLNVEPVFKYQLNTFSEVSGDFRPFSVGVYSGLNFKF